MKKSAPRLARPGIVSLNHRILTLDLDSHDPADLAAQLELRLAAVLGCGPSTQAPTCGQFTCVGYMPG